jgi:hypothetical protein
MSEHIREPRDSLNSMPAAQQFPARDNAVLRLAALCLGCTNINLPSGSSLANTTGFAKTALRSHFTAMISEDRVGLPSHISGARYPL